MMASVEVLLINLFIVAFFAVSVLYCSADYLLRAMHLHKLTVDAHALKNQYAKRLEALRYGMNVNIEIIAGGNEKVVGVDIIDDDGEAID